jgi:hypothetical protein
MSFRTLVTSLPDREKVVVEVWYNDAQVLELSNEHNSLDLEIYPRPSGEPWSFELTEFLGVLQRAKARLLNGSKGESGKK